MYQPLEYVKIDESSRRWMDWRCRIPFCWGENKAGHGLCQHHTEFANNQLGNPYHPDEDHTREEAQAAYRAHAAKAMAEIPYHLLMSSLWPGVGAKERAQQARREKTLKERWNEERDH